MYSRWAKGLLIIARGGLLTPRPPAVMPLPRLVILDLPRSVMLDTTCMFTLQVHVDKQGRPLFWEVQSGIALAHPSKYI